MRLRSIVGWTVFFSIVAVIAHTLPSARAMYYLIRGKQSFHARNYEAAMESYKKSVEVDPRFARGYVDLGSAYYALDRYTEAEEAFKNAIVAQDDSCARCGLGSVYRVTGRTMQAEIELRKSIQLNPADDCPYGELGRLYYDTKQYGKAIDVFEQKNKLRRDAVTLHFLANCYYRLRKVEESLPFYEQATSLSPDYEDVFIDQARAYNDVGRVADATKSLQRAIELNPQNLEAHAYLGVTLFLQNDRDGAMEQYRWLLTKNPTVAAELKKGLEELENEMKELKRKRNELRTD